MRLYDYECRTCGAKAVLHNVCRECGQLYPDHPTPYEDSDAPPRNPDPTPDEREGHGPYDEFPPVTGG